MYKILVIEDDLSDQMMIRTALSNHNLYTCSSASEAKKIFDQHVFDLVLIDMNLPDGNGRALFEEFRGQMKELNIPIIFLTGNKSVEDIVSGLRVGADDYIIKPFHLAELQARCENIIQKTKASQARNVHLRCSNIEVDLEIYEAFIHTPQGRKNLELTSAEFRLLIFFMRNKDRLLKREQILSGVWGDEEKLSDRTVDARVASLRKKLGPASKQLTSIHGLGYKLVNESPAQL